VDISLTYYTDSQSAIESYVSGLKLNETYPMGHKYVYCKLNADYEYFYSDTYTRANENYLFLYRTPSGEYVSEVKIRYKNVIFRFGEYSHLRESRIGEAIDMLWADYERYKEGMSLPP